ncbi:MAG: hypothetical protein ACKVS6_15130 [Planctomycetota bacterium]
MRFILSISVALAAGSLILPSCKSNYLEPAPQPKDYTRELPPGMKGLRKIDPSKYPDFGPGLNDREGMTGARRVGGVSRASFITKLFSLFRYFARASGIEYSCIS